MDNLVSNEPYVRPPIEYPPPANCFDWFLIKIGWYKPKPLRTPPLTRANEVCNFNEAVERVKYAINFHPPSTALRWDKLLMVCNRTIEPTDDDPDPIRIKLEMEEFKLVLRTMYHRAKVIPTVGVNLMREFLPKMYDKHSLERGKRVSQKERDDKGITDECYAYGELEVESFVLIYFKVCAAYGIWPKKPVFFDLGCGVGNLVYAAALVGQAPWKTCGGIDFIQELVERGEKRTPRWKRFCEGFPPEISKVAFIWEQVRNLPSGLFEIARCSCRKSNFAFVTLLNCVVYSACIIRLHV